MPNIFFTIIVVWVILRIIGKSSQTGKNNNKNQQFRRNQSPTTKVIVDQIQKNTQLAKEYVAKNSSNKNQNKQKRKKSSQSEMDLLRSTILQLQNDFKHVEFTRLKSISLMDKNFLSEFSAKSFDWARTNRQELISLILKIERILEKNEQIDYDAYQHIIRLKEALNKDQADTKQELEFDQSRTQSKKAENTNIETTHITSLGKKQKQLLNGFSAKKAVIWKEILDKPKSLR